jgi:integrase
MQTVTVRDAAKLFLEGIAGDVAPATLRLYTHYVNRFVEAHGGVGLADVSPAIVRTWGKTYHPVQAVQRMMSWCHREARLISVNPVEGMRKMPRGRRMRTLTNEESARLIRAAKGATRRLLVALRETIARPGELRRVTWNDVVTAGLKPFTLDDLAAGRAFIFLDQFKAQRLCNDPHAVRVIPISRRLGRMLARLYLVRGKEASYVFLNSRENAWTTNAVRCAFRKLRDIAAFDHDRRGERVVAYTFRHTGATNAVIAGVPAFDLGQALGHQDVRQTFRYVHLAPTFLKNVMDRIDDAKRGSKRKNGRMVRRRIDPNDAR